MPKTRDLKTVVINHIAISYFYTREKNDKNGNPRYRLYIIDPDAPAVYETIAKTYGDISDYVKNYMEVICND